VINQTGTVYKVWSSHEFIYQQTGLRYKQTDRFAITLATGTLTVLHLVEIQTTFDHQERRKRVWLFPGQHTATRVMQRLTQDDNTGLDMWWQPLRKLIHIYHRKTTRLPAKNQWDTIQWHVLFPSDFSVGFLSNCSGMLFPIPSTTDVDFSGSYTEILCVKKTSS